jgi:hypothetical protein
MANQPEEENFGVCLAVEALSFRNQCVPKGAEIVDLTVENQRMSPIRRAHRLMAGHRQVEDRKATVPKGSAWLPPPTGDHLHSRVIGTSV